MIGETRSDGGGNKARASAIINQESTPQTEVGVMPFSRRDVVLAGLSAGGSDAALYPVQVQKLFFLIDRQTPGSINGPHFNFKPYDFGPFDKDVYECIDQLERIGLASVSSTGRYRVYSLTKEGYLAGQNTLAKMDEATQTFMREAATWVLGLPFDKLVTAIYRAYPEMRVNSIFQQ